MPLRPLIGSTDSASSSGWAVVPAECRECLLQCVDPRSSFEIAVREWVQNADSTCALRLLRGRSERPRGRRTKQRDDFPSPHRLTLVPRTKPYHISANVGVLCITGKPPLIGS
jgi:hypothetical protein